MFLREKVKYLLMWSEGLFKEETEDVRGVWVWRKKFLGWMEFRRG